MLTIKPVGSMKSFFDNDEYTIDVKNCIDVILYIQAMHPKLGLFMKQAQTLTTFEDFCFLDKKGNIIDPQLFPYHKFKEDWSKLDGVPPIHKNFICKFCISAFL